MAKHDVAARVDHKRLGYAIHTQVNAQPPFGIDDRIDIRVTAPQQPDARGVRRVFVVHAVQGVAAPLRHQLALPRHQHRVLRLTGHAPRCPHVDDTRFAQQVGLRQRRVGALHAGQTEGWQWFANERRWQFARVTRHADGQQRQQGHQGHCSHHKPQAFARRAFGGRGQIC